MIDTLTSSCQEERDGCRSLQHFSAIDSALTCADVLARLETRHRHIGEFVPQCTKTGSYYPRQCHNSTGYCWCSDVHGRVINGTSRGPTDDQFTDAECVALLEICWHTPLEILSQCQQQRAAASLQEERGLLGIFVPSCEDDGTYSSRQCHGSLGLCWCVDESGKSLPRTESRPGPEQDFCDVERRHFAKRANCEDEKKIAEHSGLIGVYVPQCKKDGNYSPRQCHGSTGACWCVDPDGHKVEGTYDPATGPQSDEECAPKHTDSNSPQTPCTKRRSRSRAVEAEHKGIVGVFTPECQKDGNFASMQCHGSTGYCWCADLDGSEFPGTRIRGSEPDGCEVLRARCTNMIADPCQHSQGVEGFCEIMVPRYTFNRSVGQCMEFSVSGCQGTGNSFDTEKECKESCNRDNKFEPCRQVSWHPSCTELGDFSSLQCNTSSLGSKQECWCSDLLGNKFEGTSTSYVVDGISRSQNDDGSCDHLRSMCTECTKPGETKCTVGLQARGVNCIVGHCVKSPDSDTHDS
eukprot:gnl/MRDRNA2_/MRDRNA2_73207_c0_seq1.p1 gnl/MRDRNA2_/MRDRNA2_73207_c0~~gnl/MRDRNA2_/MRDRNA2_73207_c0_seq1.p1  ORF type:complete len:602 (+),score=64.01 gnl/MRDRNA2_/MRDRNA2_73207_c0_seq1:245-1807(+)